MHRTTDQSLPRTAHGPRPPAASIADPVAPLRVGNSLHVARRVGVRPGSLHDSAVECPRTLVVCCSDLESDPAALLGIDPNRIHVLQTPACVIGEAEVAGALYADSTQDVDLAIVLTHRRCRIVAGVLLDGVDIGAVSNQVHESSDRLLALSIRDDSSLLSDVAIVHAHRMAVELERRLPRESRLIVRPAWLDDAIGQVDFL